MQSVSTEGHQFSAGSLFLTKMIVNSLWLQGGAFFWEQWITQIVCEAEERVGTIMYSAFHWWSSWSAQHMECSRVQRTFASLQYRPHLME